MHSDRRSIWIYSDSSRSSYSVTSSDPKANWNVHLCKAIGVAYAHFLINYLINHEEIPSTKEILLNSLHTYYKLFPNLILCNTEPWVTIAKHVYAFLSQLNAPVLATIVRCNTNESLVCHPSNVDKFVIKWYNLHQPVTPDEPHFCSIIDMNTDIVDVLISIGINITDTPVTIYEQCNIISQQLVPPGKQLPVISSVESVTKYYSNFYNLFFNRNRLPCDLALTKFKGIKIFIKFVKFLIKSEECFSEEMEKSNDFYLLGLIVTADEKLHSLSDGKTIISSDNWNLFLKSRHHFVHHDLRRIYDTHSKYLMENTYDRNHFEHLSLIITVNFQ